MSSVSTRGSDGLSVSIAVEQGTNLFEGKGSVLSFGLDDGEVEVDELESDPDTVDDVVSPVEGVHGDWVDILVEDQRGVNTDLEDHETLGSDSVWQDLDSV